MSFFALIYLGCQKKRKGCWANILFVHKQHAGVGGRTSSLQYRTASRLSELHVLPVFFIYFMFQRCDWKQVLNPSRFIA